MRQHGGGNGGLGADDDGVRGDWRRAGIWIFGYFWIFERRFAGFETGHFMAF